MIDNMTTHLLQPLIALLFILRSGITDEYMKDGRNNETIQGLF